MICLVLLTAAMAANPPAEKFLHQLAVTSEVQGEVHWDQVQLVVELDQPDAPLFLQRRGLHPDKGTVTVRSLIEPVMKDPVAPRHRGDSWVMDFKEPVFNPIWAELEKQAGSKPTVADLIAFTGAYVSNKSLSRNFDLASKVAATREGDCSEHAVLLAAILRRYGFPARVMLGTVLMTTNGTPSAFGHAWVETFSRGTWKTVDAILPTALDVRYLPSAELTEEGPGFALALLPALQGLRFKRLLIKPR